MKLKPPTKLLAAASSNEIYIYNTTKLFYSTINLTPDEAFESPSLGPTYHLFCSAKQHSISCELPQQIHQHNLTIAGEEHTTASFSPLDFTVN